MFASNTRLFSGAFASNTRLFSGVFTSNTRLKNGVLAVVLPVQNGLERDGKERILSVSEAVNGNMNREIDGGVKLSTQQGSQLCIVWQ